MQLLRDLGNKFGIAGELLTFLWEAKLWWMIPMVLALLVLGIVIAFGTSTGVGPFIYTLF
jgi:uncharacterized membrane protein